MSSLSPLPCATVDLAPLLAHGGADLDRIGLTSTVVAYGLVAALAVLALALNQRWRRPRFSAIPIGTESGAPTGTAATTGAGIRIASGDVDHDPAREDDGAPGGTVVSAARVVTATLLVITIAVGWAGSPAIGVNPTPAAVLLFTLAGPVLVLLLGDLWTPLQPHATLAGAIRRGLGRSPDPLDTPNPVMARLWWIPAAGLASYAVFWLAVPDGLQPRVITAWLTTYSLVMVAIGVALGPNVTRRLEGFAVLFGAIGRLSPVGWDGGRPRLRNPIAAAGHADVDRRELAVLVVAMGVAIFDAVNATPWWAGVLGVRSEVGYTLFNTAGLAWAVGAVGVVWWGAARGSARLADGEMAPRPRPAPAPSASPADARMVGATRGPAMAPPVADDPTGDLGRPSEPALAAEADPAIEATEPGEPGSLGRAVTTVEPGDDPAADARTLAPALAVLVVGFTLAHQFGSILVNGLSVLALSSDPLSRGWDLFGTRSLYVDPDSWLGLAGWVALVGVVMATLVALILGWDRWLASGHTRPDRSMPVIFGISAATGVVGVSLLVGG